MGNLPMTQDATVLRFMAMEDAEHFSSIMDGKREVGERLLLMGKAVLAWKLKGRDLAELGLNGMTHWLLEIGSDRIYYGLVARFVRNKEMIIKLSRLPYADQKHIADGGTVALLVMAKEVPTEINSSPADLQPDQFKQVFGTDHIRPIAEQRLWIEQQKARAKKPVPDSVGHFSIDAERCLAIFNGRRGDAMDLSTAEALVRALKNAMRQKKEA